MEDISSLFANVRFHRDTNYLFDRQTTSDSERCRRHHRWVSNAFKQISLKDQDDGNDLNSGGRPSRNSNASDDDNNKSRIGAFVNDLIANANSILRFLNRLLVRAINPTISSNSLEGKRNQFF